MRVIALIHIPQTQCIRSCRLSIRSIGTDNYGAGVVEAGGVEPAAPGRRTGRASMQGVADVEVPPRPATGRRIGLAWSKCGGPCQRRFGRRR
jgi:hypothetical protein